MPISAISSVPSVAATDYLSAASAPSTTGGVDFSATLAGAVDNVQGLQATSNDLAIKALTGDLTDIHDATIAATRAQVSLELVAALRNKGVDAFNEIMRMQA